MSLIIAIEPDREQANQLKDLVRRHTRAELILADTTARAIGAIEQRVPDLVLIPAFLSPQDDEALTAALRVREEAEHVQTLTIPMLGGASGSKSTTQPGVLSRLLREQPRPASPDGCDPKVFAEQITAYLERVAQERGPLKATEMATPGTNGGGRNGRQSSARADKRTRADAPAPSSPQQIAPDETAALEIALAGVIEDVEPADDTPVAELPKEVEPLRASDEIEGLEEGLSSLMEKLSAEDWSEPEAAPVPELDLTGALDEVKVAAPPPVTRHWPEKLRQLESREYAMPNILPRDVDAPTIAEDPIAATPIVVEPAPPTKAAEPAAPAAKGRSEWGDLIESLQKELKK